MNVQHMKWLDNYLGVPICVALDVINRLSAVLRRRHRAESLLTSSSGHVGHLVSSLPTDQSAIKKIIVLKFFGMGSILLATPMLRALRESFPHAQIIFVTFASNRPFFEISQVADQTLFLRTNNFRQFVVDLLRSLWLLRRERCDACIDLEFFSKFSIIFSYLTGAPVRVGYYLREMWRGDLLTHQVYYNGFRHITEVFLALARALGADTADTRPVKLSATTADRQLVLSLLQEAGIDRLDRFVVINVNASEMCRERRWPLENYYELAKWLVYHCHRKIVLIGASEDVPYVQRIASFLDGVPGVVNLAGKVSLSQLLAVLELCELYISSDVGPLHLAAAVGAPTVSLWGPETPSLYHPVSPTNIDAQHVVLYKGIYCSPCLSAYNAKTAMCKGNNLCMKRIAVSEIIDAIERTFPSFGSPNELPVIPIPAQIGGSRG